MRKIFNIGGKYIGLADYQIICCGAQVKVKKLEVDPSNNHLLNKIRQLDSPDPRELFLIAWYRARSEEEAYRRFQNDVGVFLGLKGKDLDF